MRDEIEDVRVRLERLEAVRASLRHVERASLFLVESDAMPAEVRVGVGPEVEHDVEDRAADAPN